MLRLALVVTRLANPVRLGRETTLESLLGSLLTPESTFAAQPPAAACMHGAVPISCADHFAPFSAQVSSFAQYDYEAVVADEAGGRVHVLAEARKLGRPTGKFSVSLFTYYYTTASLFCASLPCHSSVDCLLHLCQR